MGFADLGTSIGIESLDSFLSERSYVEGKPMRRGMVYELERVLRDIDLNRLLLMGQDLYTASQADTVVFDALKSAPDNTFVHALRWFNHIKALDRSALPGVKKDLTSYGPHDSSAACNGADAFDFISSGSESEEDDEVRQQRLKAYAEKRAKKPALIAKSNIILDVKPWDDETDMKEMEKLVRSLQMDGLVWGASKLVPVGFGIKKLQISCVVEDDKVGSNILEEEICKFEDIVQSVDIAAFNKV